jgi:serine O-acetyltransferase
VRGQRTRSNARTKKGKRKTVGGQKKKLANKKIENLVEEILQTYQGDLGINFIDASNLPVRGKILEILELLFEVLFPGYTGKKIVTKSNVNFIVGDILCQLYSELSEQIERAYRYQCRIRQCEGCGTGDTFAA